MSSKNAIDKANEKLLFGAENDKKFISKEKTKEVTIIAATAENNALGKDNRLIWHLPEDLKRFKRLTSGHAIIMGRKTFESLPKALPNRHNIVISRNKNYTAPGASVCHNLEEAIALAENDIQPFIIGGGQIYDQAIEIANKIELTRIHKNYEADTFFPLIDLTKWSVESEESFEIKKNEPSCFSYLTYVKK
jgi:dihydrofolate reductase